MEKTMSTFYLKINQLKPKVIQVDFDCHIDPYLLEKALEHVLRVDPRFREIIGRSLMHSMTPKKSNDCLVIYDSNSNN
jgi:hypothetical protein